MRDGLRSLGWQNWAPTDSLQAPRPTSHRGGSSPAAADPVTVAARTCMKKTSQPLMVTNICGNSGQFSQRPAQRGRAAHTHCVDIELQLAQLWGRHGAWLDARWCAQKALTLGPHC